MTGVVGAGGWGDMVFVAAGLVERWQDMGPVLWLVAAGAAALWAVVLGIMAAITEPRRVDPGPETLDLPGSEPPAVVNLVTSDWDLGREAIPATLLDLAARGHLAVDQVGDMTHVRVRRHGGDDGNDGDDNRYGDHLTAYERMVLDHVRALAAHTADGVVPAEALTTGPGGESKRWWRRFRSEVHRDARARGLSRPRWSRSQRAVLIVGAWGVAALVAIAGSTLSGTAENGDDDPIGAMVASGAIALGAMTGAVAALAGERDTAEGRARAAQWLGVRGMLAEDPLFAEHAPAAVAIWDRHLAHGAALGVARGAVQALPLGAESDRVAWSPVGGRWRVVRIRYPRLWPPGYGWHPALVVLCGMLHLAVAAALVGGTYAGVRALDESTSASAVDRADIAHTADSADSAGASQGNPNPPLHDIALAVVLVPAAVLVARGGWMVPAGVADLVSGRRAVTGRVLRQRVRGSDDRKRWYLAVDDGTAARIRAWRFRRAVVVPQGATVRASVSPRTGHVRDLAAQPAGIAAGEPADRVEPR